MAILALAGCLLASAGSAQTEVQVQRYSTVRPVARPEESQLLAAVIRVDFPRAVVHSVGDAIHYLLPRSGYRLYVPLPTDPAMTNLLSLPLPEAHRQLGPITVAEALGTLAGSGYQVLADQVRRRVTFRLTPGHRAAFETPDSDPSRWR